MCTQYNTIREVYKTYIGIITEAVHHQPHCITQHNTTQNKKPEVRNPIRHVNRDKERWLPCCHGCKLWCSFIFELAYVRIHPESQRIKGPGRLLTRFKGEHLEPVRTSPGFLDGWLKFTQILPYTIGGRVHRKSRAPAQLIRRSLRP